ncbi:MAG: helix-turn-helix domain-containing protein [Brachybacterium sp.]|nr:helix-turn-helix domain-containing protein [Brachybacterium sp.]
MITEMQPTMTREHAASDGRSTRWARHREERRAQLLDVARRLIHAQGPDVTMENIAAASGTSKSIVYRYFSDKAQLQRALGMHILSAMHRRLVAEVEQVGQSSGGVVGTEARIRAMISSYIETAAASPNVYRFITRPSDGLNHFLQSVTRLVATTLPAETPAPLAAAWASGAVGFVEGAVDAWMRTQTSATTTPDSADSADGALDAADLAGPRSTGLGGQGLPAIPLDAEQLCDALVTWLMHGVTTMNPTGKE